MFHGPVGESPLLPVLLAGLLRLPLFVSLCVVPFFLFFGLDGVPLALEVGPVVVGVVTRPLISLLLRLLIGLLPPQPLFKLLVVLTGIVLLGCLLLSLFTFSPILVLALLVRLSSEEIA